MLWVLLSEPVCTAGHYAEVERKPSVSGQTSDKSQIETAVVHLLNVVRAAFKGWRQSSITRFLIPLSSKVGTSGRFGDRVAVDCARKRSVPAL
jgi:hypothetical protein